MMFLFFSFLFFFFFFFEIGIRLKDVIKKMSTPEEKRNTDLELDRSRCSVNREVFGEITI